MKLIFELNTKGHTYEYLEQVIRYLNVHPELKKDYLFLLSPEAVEFFGESLNGFTLVNLAFNVGSGESVVDSQNSFYNRIRSSIIISKNLKKIILTYNIKELIFMNIDSYQLVIGIRYFFSESVLVSGILFGSYLRIASSQASFGRKAVNSINQIRKYIQTRWMLRNPNVKKIFVLNDKESSTKFNQNLKPIFQYIPEPLVVPPTENTFEVRSKYGIRNESILLLSYGLQSHKKNNANFIKSFSYLDSVLANRVTFLVIGQFYTEDYYQELQRIICDYKGPVQIVCINTYIQGAERESLLREADILATAYLNHIASSANMGHAMRHNKPCVISNYGLMAELCQEYQFGELVDPLSPKDIAAKLTLIIRNRAKYLPLSKRNQYLNEHDGMRFAEILLDRIE